jgi:hypothetical protein
MLKKNKIRLCSRIFKKLGYNLLSIYFVILKRAFYLCGVYFVTYFKPSSKGNFS